jgi:hypothetical protein
LIRLVRNMRTLPQYAALVNSVLPVCYVIDLRKQHREGRQRAGGRGCVTSLPAGPG